MKTKAIVLLAGFCLTFGIPLLIAKDTNVTQNASVSSVPAMPGLIERLGKPCIIAIRADLFQASDNFYYDGSRLQGVSVIRGKLRGVGGDWIVIAMDDVKASEVWIPKSAVRYVRFETTK